MTGDVPAERAARNESLFREHNESVEMDNAIYQRAGSALAEWICECADEACAVPVQLTVAEYEAVRADATHFLVAPGEAHITADIERVVKREERYWIVEKRGRAAEVSEKFDPRGPSSIRSEFRRSSAV
jgi:hypothetical protein